MSRRRWNAVERTGHRSAQLELEEQPNEDRESIDSGGGTTAAPGFDAIDRALHRLDAALERAELALRRSK